MLICLFAGGAAILAQATAENIERLRHEAEQENRQAAESTEYIYTFQDYTVRIYRQNGEKGIADLMEILKGNQIVHRMRNAGLYVGYDPWNREALSKKGVDIRLVQMGQDITGNGIPNLLVEEWSGGAHCCFAYHLFEIGKKFRKIAVIPIGEAYYFYFARHRPEKGLVVKGHDGAFAYWRSSFAGSPAPEIMLRFKDGKYCLAPDLMQKPAPSESVFNERKAQVAAEWPQPGQPDFSSSQPPSLWSFMLDLIYSGQADRARRFLDEAWPSKEPGRVSFAAEFYSQLATSNYWHDLSNFYPELKANLKDALEQCRQAAARGDAEAQFILGGIYANGHGVAQNYAEAYAWYTVATANNEGLSAGRKGTVLQARDVLRQKMTPEQITTGEARAKTVQAGLKRK